MGWNDHVDFELHERIDELLELGHFEKGTKEYGIARMVADGGHLSPKQQVVWDKWIVPILDIPINDEERLQRALEEDWKREFEERPSA